MTAQVHEITTKVRWHDSGKQVVENALWEDFPEQVAAGKVKTVTVKGVIAVEIEGDGILLSSVVNKLLARGMI